MAEWINFAELRARVSLEDVIVRYYGITTLKRDGPKLVGPCPVHGGDSPRAFHADLDKNVWHCFSQCQKGGNQLDFVALKENIGIREAALKLQAFLLSGTPAPLPAAAPPTKTTDRTTQPPPTKPTTTSKPRPKKKDDEDEEDEDDGNAPLAIKLDLKGDHPHLVEDCKLHPTTVAHFGIGYCSRGIMRGTIAIPIHDEDGDLVAYAGRRLKSSDIREFGKYKLPKGFKKERVLFNYHRAKEKIAEGLVVVEGFFATMKLFEAGLTNVVAPMGVEVSDYQVERLATAPELIILFDGDEAGRTGAAALAQKITSKSIVRIVHLPDGMKPDQLSPKALRWITNGVRQLGLAELRFTFAPTPPPASDSSPSTAPTATT